MKKTLIALAAVAASSVAFAQSNVTMYGVADLGLSKASGSSAQMSGNGKMNNGNSRLGVRGTEDLGGGLKASFNFEMGINAETGATEAVTFGRNAFMELGGGFGTVRMGRSLSNGFFAASAYELTGAANYSALGGMFGWVGGARNNSEFRYTTPNMNGITASLGHIMKDDNGGNSKNDMNAIYRGGPIVVGFAYSKASGSERSVSLGGSYNFGVAKVAASFQDPAGAVKGYTLGVSAPLGATTVALDIARDTGSAVKSTDYVMEVKYALSKRTFAYGALHRDGSAKVNSTGVGIRHNF